MDEKKHALVKYLDYIIKNDKYIEYKKIKHRLDKKTQDEIKNSNSNFIRSSLIKSILTKDEIDTINDAKNYAEKCGLNSEGLLMLVMDDDKE